VSLAEAASLAGELYARSLIIDDGQRIAFANDVMREFVYNEMSSIQRTALHLGAGQALESDVGSPPGSLATHFYHGDDWPRSFGYAMEAACEAQRTAGHAEAAHFARIAAEVAPGAAERKAALTTRAESLYAAGDLAEAATTYSKLLTLGRSRGSEATARTYLKLAETHIERCKWQEARRVIEESHCVVEEVGDSELGLSLRADRATLLLKYALRTSDAEAASEATRCINATLSGLRGVNMSASAAWLAVLLAKAMLLGVEGKSREALEYLERANLHVPASDHSQATRYYNYRGVVKAWLADWDGAEADFHKARKIAETTGDRVGLTTQWNNLACVALERGEWGEAQDRLNKAERAHREICFSNDASLPIVLNRADLLFYQGYSAPAADAYTRAVKICEEQESNDRRGEALACLGLVALQRGQGEEAKRLWQILCETEARSDYELGTRERFKIAWFSSAMASNMEADGRLLRAAEREKERDRPSHLKLLWLSTVLEQDEAVDRNAAKEALQAHGLGWFCHVANRWTRLAMRA
jgi:tetratricopeptide (TPR) repeat protein